jgi:hypothetical protein
MMNLLCLPFLLLALGAMGERIRWMRQEHRSEALDFVALLVGVIGLVCLYGASTGRWIWGGEFDALVVLSAPLIARNLVARDFLFHRGVRITAAAALGIGWIFYSGARQRPELVGLAVIPLVALLSRWVPLTARTPWPHRIRAVLTGTYFAYSTSLFLRF